jgi:hypothetical protein
VAIVLAVLIFNWLSNRTLEGTDEDVAANVAVSAPPPLVAPPPQAAQPVVISASDTAWIEVKDGALILKQGELAAGQSFAIPASAAAPTLTTAKPEALRIAVGTAQAPAIGDAGKKVTVSLKPDDLLRAPPTTAQPQPATARESVRTRPAETRPAAPPPATTTTPADDAAQPAAATPQP